MTIAEAVERLRGFALFADTRESPSGMTIVVATDPDTSGGITVYGRMMHIAQTGDGWIGWEFDRPRSDDDVPRQLGDACDRAISILTQRLEMTWPTKPS